ncbi:adenylyl-sulfate kinase [Tessaracoccus defluvii]|uniref:adenylyl-sulfate kinase n=1 Tax=Tessaracoccus defluvii TaxID=1285901 RepID=UPI0031CE51EE
MPDRHPDWAWIASLPSLFVRGSDLARVELFQQGRLGTPLRLTQAGRRAVGRARTFVVRDPDSTPLLVATLTGDRLEAQSLRPVEEIDWHLPGAVDLLAAELPATHPEPAAPPSRGGAVVFLTGLSGAGKSTVGRALRERLVGDPRPVTLLDGDDVRRFLSPDLGFDEASRATNVRRVSWVASLLAGAGGIAITALIAPYAEQRAEARGMAERAGATFVEVWLATPLADCEARDRKGLYSLARSGLLENFTGVSAPYEEPQQPTVTVDTTTHTPEEAAEQIAAVLTPEGGN